jgi:2-polyprenyl-3-methyl-5-hydroxy-6-metoxy-1,4-benzoquinol methylase
VRTAGRIEVLDIAAGHGLYGIAFAKLNPQAKITAVDWRNVLQVATENAAAAGVGSRHRTIPGSAFEVDFDGTYDVVLLTNFLHHFDVPTCEAVLKRLHAALRPGGRAAILEFVPNDDRVIAAERRDVRGDDAGHDRPRRRLYAEGVRLDAA